MKNRKEIAKSIRMTKEVYEIVNAFHGEGFNEKFENLVLFYQKEEQEIKSRVNQLIKSEKDIIKRVEDKRNILDSLNRVSSYVTDLTSFCSISNCNSILPFNRDSYDNKRVTSKGDK